ncbi:MAG: ankyrin repeat domain-containing protein [Usitatibacter sp.]
MRIPAHLAAILILAASAGGAPAHAADSDLSVNARLLHAARNSDAQGVARALESGASPDARNRFGETTLLVALRKKDAAIADAMLAAGAHVDIAAVNGVTPLMAAAFTGDARLAKALLDRGADPAPVDRLGKSAMTYAAGEGHAAIVGLLLAKGVDPNAVYRNDLTALMWAAGYGKSEAARALPEAGARTSPRDNRGKSAADIAREGGFAETLALIETWTEAPARAAR